MPHIDTVNTWIENTNTQIKQVEQDLCWAKVRKGDMLTVARLEKKLQDLLANKDRLLTERLEVKAQRAKEFKARKEQKRNPHRKARVTTPIKKVEDNPSFGNLADLMDPKQLTKMVRKLNK